MSISVEKSDSGEVVIVLSERFDFDSVGPFRKAYESLGDKNKKVVMVDFKNTRSIDSSALGMLINARKFFDQYDVKIKIINVNEKITKIFSISRFDKKFDIS